MEKLGVELKKEYAYSIELNVEVVEDKIFDIEDLISKYIDNSKLPNEVKIEYFPQFKKESISHSYIIKIQSDAIAKKNSLSKTVKSISFMYSIFKFCILTSFFHC